MHHINDLRLLPDEVHVWAAIPTHVRQPEHVRRCWELLDEEERARHERFVYTEHRHQFLVSHALVRTVLSRYAEVHPGDWTFTRNEFGRPDVEVPPGQPPLRINLSHTRGWLACAVTLDREVGVDVEEIRHELDVHQLAHRYFSASEAEELLTLPPSQQRQRFFDLWTLKEAYLKARGIGLALGLGDFSFHREEPRQIRVAFGAAIGDDPRTWQFALFEPSRNHRLAVAVRRGIGPELQLRFQHMLPLAGHRV